VPLNANGAKTELKADLQRCGADLVVGLSSLILDDNVPRKKRAKNPFSVVKESQEIRGFDHVQEAASTLGIQYVGLVPSKVEAGIFRLVGGQPHKGPKPLRRTIRINNQDADATGGRSQPPQSISRFSANHHDDEVLVLFTSGTTGNKKIVPHHLGDMLVASATISLSWNLGPNDVNCNLMPLFHVGGIVRQVFSPILSGGCVICCPAFDPTIFWALLQRQKFNWYYAAPTMHQIILQSKEQEFPNGKAKLRMIANAAGGLLPSLARELRQTFSANVLPSYGMTECMPISSPPHTYQLEKPGTSGVAVGPEIGILNLQTLKPLPFGKEGPICVRGAPCFRGYGYNQADPSQALVKSFLDGGWFNTGDLGYMDSDGYLFITGRSKEVINRGGEIISPLEVEEAVVAHHGIVACAAFSVPHNVLQEVVGIVIVPEPGKPKLDLQSLHDFLGDKLVASKWPQLICFMNALPKSHTNKLLRVKLGQRLGLPEINDAMYPIERTFQAKCPPQGTPMQVAIVCERVSVKPMHVQTTLARHLVQQHDQQIVVTPHPSRLGSLVCHVYNIDRVKAIEVARECLDQYLVPSHFCELKKRALSERDLLNPGSLDAVAAILQGPMGEVEPLVAECQVLFQDLLDLDCLPAVDTNFFNLGGSSMMASQLASKIRKRHDISFSGAEVFHHASCQAVADLIKERKCSSLSGGGNSTSTDQNTEASSVSSHNRTASSTSSFHKNVNTQGSPFPAERLQPSPTWCTNLIQLIPLCVAFPIWQVTRFYLFFSFLLVTLHRTPAERNLFMFIITLVIFHLLWVFITPLVFVMIKWTVIGRYRRGRYPIYGGYYLRWWTVDVCRKLFARGIWGSNEYMLNFYYRLLGAKIGPGARISLEADVAEFDLVEIGSNAALEYSTVRAFGVDNGCMILGPVRVGNNASVGCRSIVAPFTSVPDNGHLGPVSSSYEVGDALSKKHKNYNRYAMPEPSFSSRLFIGNPITFLVDSFSHIPALFVLWWMVSMPWHEKKGFDTMSDMMQWLCDPRRIPFYIGIRIARYVISPFFYMAAALFVKKTIIGKFEPGPRVNTEWELMRHWLAASLFSRQNMQEIVDLIGRHYENVSILYRLLGAKIGKRVFWPGHQPIFSGTFELLEIGDDVVFGSRSVILCCSTEENKKIILCAGSNVSDNCVVLPGTIIGKNAVLGSNSICPEDRYLPEASVYFGARGCEPVCLEKGVEKSDAIMMSTKIPKERLPFTGGEDTIRPFGKAFYRGEASYWVMPLGLIILFTSVAKIVIAGIHTLPLLAAVHGAAGILYGFPISERSYMNHEYGSHIVFGTILFVFFFAHIARVFVWIGLELSAKWGLMGRREEGRYNYDKVPYAQNWEIYQILTRVRRNGRMNLLDFIAGTPFISEFFRWNGAKIGKDCCLFPTGGDPYFTEPDLIEIGDRCVIDCAAVVAHLNTRGNFELAKIVVENHVTLRARSRIQEGVHMEAGSMLLEKSLAMTGEVIEADSVWQGAPAARLFSYPSETIRPSTSFTAGPEIFGTSNFDGDGDVV